MNFEIMRDGDADMYKFRLIATEVARQAQARGVQWGASGLGV